MPVYAGGRGKALDAVSEQRREGGEGLGHAGAQGLQAAGAEGGKPHPPPRALSTGTTSGRSLEHRPLPTRGGCSLHSSLVSRLPKAFAGDQKKPLIHALINARFLFLFL